MGLLSELEREKWSHIQKALLGLDSKFCVLYLAHYCNKHIVNTSLSAYILLDFCVCVCNFGRQASQEKDFNILYTSCYVPENLLCNRILTLITQKEVSPTL